MPLNTNEKYTVPDGSVGGGPDGPIYSITGDFTSIQYTILGPCTIVALREI